MIIHEVEQRTDEWRKLRAGKFTASNFDKLFMGKSTKGYQDLINTVVYERLTEDIPETYTSEWMQRGNDLEAEALERYELETFSKISRVGFIELDEWIGCSPDAFVGEEGLTQAKCPKYNTHIFYLLNPQKAIEEYKYQLQGEIFVTERKWDDLICYHPKLSPLIQRVERDEQIITNIKKELTIAVELVKERIKHIKGAL